MKHTKCVGKTRILVQTKMHKCSLCTPKCTSKVRVNHDAHCSTLLFRVYTCAVNVHFYVIDLSCTCKLRCEYFQKRVELCSCLTCVCVKLSCIVGPIRKQRGFSITKSINARIHSIYHHCYSKLIHYHLLITDSSS